MKQMQTDRLTDIKRNIEDTLRWIRESEHISLNGFGSALGTRIYDASDAKELPIQRVTDCSISLSEYPAMETVIRTSRKYPGETHCFVDCSGILLHDIFDAPENISDESSAELLACTTIISSIGQKRVQDEWENRACKNGGVACVYSPGTTLLKRGALHLPEPEWVTFDLIITAPFARDISGSGSADMPEESRDKNHPAVRFLKNIDLALYVAAQRGKKSLIIRLPDPGGAHIGEDYARAACRIVFLKYLRYYKRVVAMGSPVKWDQSGMQSQRLSRDKTEEDNGISGIH